MVYKTLTIKDLQRLGNGDDEGTLIELGRRVLDLDFRVEGDRHICEYRNKLEDLELSLESEIPPECPHCGKFIGDV